jgi:NitT/TauT family transport system permease protein
MKRNLQRLALSVAPPLGLFCALLLLWHAATVRFQIPAYLVPRPARVARAAAGHGRELLTGMGITGSAAACGFLLSLTVGFLIAFGFSQSKLVRRSCYPYAIFLQTVPIVAIAPLIINWFGTGFPSVVLVSCIISLFPFITNGTTGLTAVDPRLLELFEVHNASRLQVLWKLRLPHSVPYFVTGAKTSSGLSIIGAIVGEFFAGYGTERFGLGYIITQTSGQLKTDYLFAAVLACTLLGVAVFGAVTLTGDLILRLWHEPAAQPTKR